MKKILTTVAGLAVLCLLAPADLEAQGRGKGKKPPVKRGGDNQDDAKSGKKDRVGDGNSGQGDDLHRKRKGPPPEGDQPRKRRPDGDADQPKKRGKKDGG